VKETPVLRNMADKKYQGTDGMLGLDSALLETQMKQRCYYVREIETMIPGRDSQ
jgi:hypothetical protein